MSREYNGIKYQIAIPYKRTVIYEGIEEILCDSIEEAEEILKSINEYDGYDVDAYINHELDLAERDEDEELVFAQIPEYNISKAMIQRTVDYEIFLDELEEESKNECND